MSYNKIKLIYVNIHRYVGIIKLCRIEQRLPSLFVRLPFDVILMDISHPDPSAAEIDLAIEVADALYNIGLLFYY